ncbi:GatB/YqeY domain-containing protein [Butyrivibrio sp. NC3005]|uniref:GatB/YqeY domain-containing protein n=1 Tax=Butyrivibrio sp. NC3005 TaxID=1280685 RepID=UPI00040EB008|nr:GatB/YqeY domain-containing protein [Butyrivibrio sp. NC3005]
MQFETLQKAMITAMKARDKARKDAISSLVSDVKKAAIDAGSRDNISEELVDKVILKSLKTAKEQLDTCPDDRTDLKEEYQFRYDVIKEYAPSMMSEDEIRKFLTENFADVIASGNKGAIMKAVMPALKGKADGKAINMIVAELTNKND